jgi:hypothetical protein
MKKSGSIKVNNTKLSTAGGILPLVAAILFIFSPADVHAWDPFKIGKAGEHAHQAISELSATVNKLPEQIKDSIGANIKLLSRDMEQMVSRINNQTVPLLNASMTTQLNHMVDLTNALTDHLNEIAKKGITQIDQDTAARLNQLQSMARDTLNQVQGMIQADIELVSNSVVKVWKQTDATVIKLINQWFYDAIRFASLFLFLIGLLLLGLRLFRFVEKRITFTHLFRHSFILALLSFAVIVIFLGATLYFTINPGGLPGLSARIHHLEKEHPCRRLKTQQDHLVKAKEIGDERLITATLDRVKEAYENCFEHE